VSRLKAVRDETQAGSYLDALQTLFELSVQERGETPAGEGKESKE
jgi:hypothetical protein